MLPHSLHVVLSLPLFNTLNPGSNGPVFCSRNDRNSWCLSHSFNVICAGFSSAFGACSALLWGSSSTVKNPPFVSVILLKSYSTYFAKFRAGWIESSGRKPPFGAGSVLRPSRSVAGTFDVEIEECGRFWPAAMVLEERFSDMGWSWFRRASASRWSRRALAFRRLSSWSSLISKLVVLRP